MLVGIAGELVARRNEGRGGMESAEMKAVRAAITALLEGGGAGAGGERVKLD